MKSWHELRQRVGGWGGRKVEAARLSENLNWGRGETKRSWGGRMGGQGHHGRETGQAAGLQWSPPLAPLPSPAPKTTTREAPPNPRWPKGTPDYI